MYILAMTCRIEHRTMRDTGAHQLYLDQFVNQLNDLYRPKYFKNAILASE
jgi:hypothetical protein